MAVTDYTIIEPDGTEVTLRQAQIGNAAQFRGSINDNTKDIVASVNRIYTNVKKEAKRAEDAADEAEVLVGQIPSIIQEGTQEAINIANAAIIAKGEEQKEILEDVSVSKVNMVFVGTETQRSQFVERGGIPVYVWYDTTPVNGANGTQSVPKQNVILFTYDENYATGSMAPEWLSEDITSFIVPACTFIAKTSAIEFKNWHIGNISGAIVSVGDTIQVQGDIKLFAEFGNI